MRPRARLLPAFVTAILVILASYELPPGETFGVEAAHAASSREQDNLRQCEGGRFVNKTLSPQELREVLVKHDQWRKTAIGLPEPSPGERADLCGARLDGADLTAAFLGGVNLTGAFLAGTNFTEAYLGNANLTGAWVYRTNFTKAELIGANLTRAYLDGANFTGAGLSSARFYQAHVGSANLTGANLHGADLTQAYLGGTNLTGANLRGANLALARFDLKSGALPDIASVALARNLSAMTFYTEPSSLVELREAFKKNGLRQPEREVTFAIKRRER